MLCGGTVEVKKLFDKEEYSELGKIALNMNDEELAAVIQSIGDDSELIERLKAVYDWSVLVDMLNGKETLSEAKVEIYDKHKEDLKALKKLVRKYLPEKYKEIFCETNSENNYVAYIHKGRPLSKKGNAENRKTPNRADFCKYLRDIVKAIKPSSEDEALYLCICERIERSEFLPKQVDGDNRVIPYQLYYYEMKRILDNASVYLPFLNEADSECFTVKDKLLSIMEFRIPYYVGPLREKNDGSRLNHWMVRKEEGTVYPWNFEQKVDLDESEQAFIKRMTNTCTYCPGEEVLPKSSLLYTAFEVLNEINALKINGNAITVPIKQEIYKNVFEKHKRVTPKRIKDYLISNNHMTEKDELGGIDETVKSSLKTFFDFENLRSSGKLTDKDVEIIIARAAYSEERKRLEKWLEREHSQLPLEDIKYISGLNLKEFGRFSRKFLNGIVGTDKNSGESFTIIRALWETNCVLMQLLSDDYTFGEELKKFADEYYGRNPKTLPEQMEELYLSNSVKRPIFRTLDILRDIVKVKGCEPKMIFVETTRGEEPSKKGKRTTSRYERLRELSKYFSVEIRKELEELGDNAESKLQSDKLFLYFIQNGKCLYTGEEMGIENILSGNGNYNIEHIYPRTLVKDDSVLNNIILVNSKINGEKSNGYPINLDIQIKVRDFWDELHKKGLLTDEKYSRLVRITPFSEKEKFEFLNRQLVETGQSAKAVVELLRKCYPKTELVYVKVQLASEFRKEFKLPKSRAVNDLHHAKDAYLNIVTGSVWHFKFGKKFYNKDAENNRKPEMLYTHEVRNGKQTVWHGVADKDKVVAVVKKNTAYITRYEFCRKGKLFDVTPLPAAEGLFELKKGKPTEKYGGYNSTTATFFVLVKYNTGKKTDIMVMPVELLASERFMNDVAFAEEYARKTISKIENKPVENVEFLLNKRKLKVNTVLSLDGLRVCITGKASGGKQLGIEILTPFKTSFENEVYIKKLEAFNKKQKQNPEFVLNAEFDKISAVKNLEIYDMYIEKFCCKPFKYRPNNPVECLRNGRSKFEKLSSKEQVTLLLEIQGLFGKAKTANLKEIGGDRTSGANALSSKISNWKKNYTDVRIIDTSASGVFETVSDNLFKML